MSVALIRSASVSALNDAQRLAVEHGIDDPKNAGPLLVIAGAGSGKTNVLAHRVARLIDAGVDPRRIMLATFSRRAAVEMGRRVQRLLKGKMSDAAAEQATPTYAGTFHAIGARLLREYAAQIGLDPQFTILDREDAADLMNWSRHELDLTQSPERFPAKATCLSIYSRTVSADDDLRLVLSRHYPWAAAHEARLRELFGRYVEAKQRQAVLDYDDLLLYFSHMLKEREIARAIAERFDHLLVDEYQDTNRLQAEIALALRPEGRGLTVVGDDAQAIYSFRAATVRNILDFPSSFSPPARVVTLEQNYRSTQPILSASNAVISRSEERFAKILWSSRPAGQTPTLASVPGEIEQAAFVATRVLEARERGAAFKSQAVLFRASHHSAALELELTRRNIPFVKYGGLKFLDAAHIKDTIAVLRWAENPRDQIAGFRVAQLLPGVGPSKAEKIVALAGAGDGFASLTGLAAQMRDASPLGELAALMARLAARAGGWPAELADAAAWRRASLPDHYDDHQARAADLDALERIGATFATRERFLSEITLDPPDATSDEAGPPLRDEDYLILSTIHSAKGLEWRSVFVLNCVDGCIPSDLATGAKEDIEEERRLLYVAMTRAKDELSLIVPQKFYAHGQPRRGDRHVYAMRTRFISADMLALFDEETWPPADAAQPLAPLPERAVDLSERMRKMWG